MYVVAPGGPGVEFDAYDCAVLAAGCQRAPTPVVSRTAPVSPARRPRTVLEARVDDEHVWMLLPAPLVRGAWLAYQVRRWDGPSFNDVDSRHGRLRALRASRPVVVVY